MRTIHGMTKHLLIACFTSIVSGCAPATMTPATQAVPLTGVLRLPDRPDLVTAIPFRYPAGHEHDGSVFIEAVADGQRGTFILDVGSPEFQFVADSVQPSQTGGIEPAHPGRPQKIVHITIHTLQVGTIVVPMSPTIMGAPPNASGKTNGVILPSSYNMLGNLGLTSIEPFETIIDYAQQRVVFIRLDTAGRRLLPVPAYTPLGAVALVPGRFGKRHKGWTMTPEFWAIEGVQNDTVDTLPIDTGAPENDRPDSLETQAADQFRQNMIAAHAARRPSSVRIVHGAAGVSANVSMDPRENFYKYELNSRFLNRLGAVGFNLRTHQFIIYQ